MIITLDEPIDTMRSLRRRRDRKETDSNSKSPKVVFFGHNRTNDRSTGASREDTRSISSASPSLEERYDKHRTEKKGTHKLGGKDLATNVIQEISVPIKAGSDLDSVTPNPNDMVDGATTRRAMTQKAVSKDESKLKKIAIRLISGISMVLVFLGFLYMGHVYICSLIFLTEVVLVSESIFGEIRFDTHRVPCILCSLPDTIINS